MAPWMVSWWLSFRRFLFIDNPQEIRMMIRRKLIKSLATAVAALTLCGAAVAQSFPSRPITMIVPWGAGGGTDATARIVAALMEKEMGQPVNVVNRTGGNGVVGHSAIATAPADGYTIGMITVEISMMHWAGLTQLSPTDYTPISLMNIDPNALRELVQLAAAPPVRLSSIVFLICRSVCSASALVNQKI
jgi:tripartite-type tricarboxylate transporter receptor subunit TctC